MPLGKSMLTRTGWASKFGFILDIRSLSLSEMVQLINSEAPKDAASDKSGLKGFYKALESISIETVEICAAPLSAVTIFLPESEYHPGGKVHCSMGMEASVEIKILMLTFKFEFSLSITEGTMKFGMALYGMKEAREALIGAVKERLSDGNGRFEVLMKLIEDFFSQFGLNQLSLEAGIENKALFFNFDAEVMIPSLNWFGGSEETMVASEAVQKQSTTTKDISLSLSVSFASFLDMVKGWGKQIIAKALDIFGMPPYADGHICFKNKHCLSNNCHIGICWRCSHHKTAMGCQTGNNVGDGTGGCFWFPTEGNCNTNYRNSLRRASCNTHGCKWPDQCYPWIESKQRYTNPGEPGAHDCWVGWRKYGAFCQGTWNGGFHGTCKPSKCGTETPPNCPSGQPCSWGSVCNGKDTNPAYPSGQMPTPKATEATIKATETTALVVPKLEDKQNDGRHPLGRPKLRLRSDGRPKDEDGFRPGSFPNATFREHRRLKAAAQHQAFLADHAGSLADEIKDLETAHANWAAYTKRVNRTANEQLYKKVLHPHEMMQLLLHEITSKAFPEAYEVNELNLGTEAADAAFDASMRSLSRLYDKIGVEATGSDDVMPHTPVTLGEWHTKHQGTIMLHLLDEMRTRKDTMH